MSMDVGVYSRAELRKRGLDGWILRKELAGGSLFSVRNGWYAVPSADTVVVEAVRLGGALSCVSALRKHGLWVPSGYSGVHVRASRHGKQQLARSCQGPGRPVPVSTALDPIPIALGCAFRCMSDEDWIAGCDSVLNTLRLSVPALQAEMGRIPQKMYDLMSKCDPNSQSGTESLARVRLRAAGFSVHVQPDIAGVGRVDLRIGRLLIECDSVTHHTSLENYRNDRRRDRTALVNKWMTMRLTYDDVLYGWDEVMADIRAITDSDRHRIRSA
ncbi:hypothetical protein DFR67_102346 [Williamsia limnetica]|uniref:Very-short-patch-repair endonuclease n=1 Tax=Williamsia limnetica TaxID=882452 RepID=A0A318RS12_WILLI|nr:hypothetical protein DFR67_102346 [Williamsia limnetica]